MLDAHAELERLGGEGYAAPGQHAEGIAGTVADGQHHDLGRQVAAGGAQSPDAAAVEMQVFDPRVEAYLAAEPLDPLPQGLDHGRQAVAS